MEKMKLQGEDKKVMELVGMLQAWCLSGRIPASGKESRLRFRKMGKGEKGRRGREGGMGKDGTIKGGSRAKGQDTDPLPSCQALTRW